MRDFFSMVYIVKQKPYIRKWCPQGSLSQQNKFEKTQAFSDKYVRIHFQLFLIHKASD